MSRWPSAGVVLGLAVSGCGGDDGGGGGAGAGGVVSYAEGSRLRPRVLDGGQGARVFVEFFDEELQIPCWFRHLEDGSLRCLPTWHEALYVDATCTEPAVAVGCEGPLAATLGDSTECDDVPLEGFLPIGGEPFTSERVLADAASSCGPQGEQISMVRAERVPLDRFVRGELEDVPITSDVMARRIVAEDGASLVLGFVAEDRGCALDAPAGTCPGEPGDRLDPEVDPSCSSALETQERGTGRILVRARGLAGVTGAALGTDLHDVELDTPCAPMLTARGDMRCIPGLRGFGGLGPRPFEDAACTTPLFRAGGTDSGGTVDNRFAAASESCAWTMGDAAYDGVIVEVLERGERYEGAVYQTGELGGCTPAEGFSEVYSVGTRHPVEDFAILDRSP